MNRKDKHILVGAAAIAVIVLLAASICRYPHPANAERNEPYAEQPANAERNEPYAEQPTVCSGNPADSFELPHHDDSSEQVIYHAAYTVGYNPTYHLPNWVAYCLEGNEVDGDFSRTNTFLPDPLVAGDPVVTQDYTGSGYDRGHMAPAADMKWSEQAMKESFYMTNICPQNHNNNAGDWKDLEELVRDVARKYGNTYICVGPIVSDTSVMIGHLRRIVVPQAFYKVLLRQKTDGTWTSIGFIMPNEPGNRPLMSYMVSVNDVESIAGIDFFPNLPDTVEEAVESHFEVADWTI